MITAFHRKVSSMTNPNNNSKQPSLKEWAMAGGGVPKNYEGRAYDWHKVAKGYAAGGEIFNTVPDMADGGQIIEGPAYAEGGKVT